MRFATTTLLCLTALTMPSISQAQNYPTRAVKIVVPFSAASSADNLARLLAEKLAARFKQPFIIDNRVGAGGTIGVAAVTKAPPDGYTLLLTTSSPLVINPLIDKSVLYNAETDLQPVAMLSAGPLLLVSSPQVPAGNLGELLALIRANPGKYSYASNGNGSYSHMAMELFKRVAKVNLVHIPYKGPAQAEADVIGGQVTVMFDAVGTGSPMIKAGRLRSYGVSSRGRDPAAPEQKPIAQQGISELKDFEVLGWAGLLAPRGTSLVITEALATATRDILADPAFHEQMRTRNVTLVQPQVASSMAAQIRSDRAKWGELVKAADIRLD